MQGLIEGFDYLDFRYMLKTGYVTYFSLVLNRSQWCQQMANSSLSKIKEIMQKYSKTLYSSPSILSLVADDIICMEFGFGSRSILRGLGDETNEEVVSHPILRPVIACLDKLL